jgi:hypothetical protein
MREPGEFRHRINRSFWECSSTRRENIISVGRDVEAGVEKDSRHSPETSARSILFATSFTIFTGPRHLVNATTASAKRIPGIRGFSVSTVMGVDFSGAARSGKTAWMAELVPEQPLKLGDAAPRFSLKSLQPLGRLAGAEDRESVNAYLVDRMAIGTETFWGCDFPFGLPVELRLGDWEEQLSHTRNFRGSAKDFGLSLVARTEKYLARKHVRRATDLETQTPFDCYHYRIIYQTFHGMRDVLAHVAQRSEVAVLPFQYSKSEHKSVQTRIVEACPSSTLKRLGLPHQRYKQSGGKPPDATQRKNRRVIMKELTRHVEISAHRRKTIMDDPGGDALDAVLAGLGAWLGFSRADHRAIASHRRYPQEGLVYC